MMNLSGKALTDTYPLRSPLCGRRYDNGFAFASSSNGHPRTCFEDVVLVPLASWLFYLVLVSALVLILSHKSAKQNRVAKRFDALHTLVHRSQPYGDASSSSERWTSKRPKLATTLSIIYSLLMIAALLMNILEIVRLYLADRGAGLLPFTLASILIIIIAVHTPWPQRFLFPLNLAILTFWTLSLVFTSVKLATLTSLQDIEPRANTEYLDSDQIIDVGVIVGLYAIMVIGETFRVLRLAKEHRQIAAETHTAISERTEEAQLDEQKATTS